MSHSPIFLEVELRDLPDVRVLNRLLLFQGRAGNPDHFIRPAFRELRRQATAAGLAPDTLLHVGVPELVDGRLVSYDCCIEFPLPEAGTKRLPGGRYAVLTVEKKPALIRQAIRTFQGDFLPEHGWVVDEDRPVYEIYFKDTLEYCLPVR